MNIDISREFRMEPEIEALYREFDQYLQKNRHRIKGEVEQFELKTAQNHLTYGGIPLAVGFYPVILSKAQSHSISTVVELMIGLMEKATSLFLQEPEVRDFFGFSPEQVELVEIDPGYSPSIPCARFDSFFDGKSLRFTELNTDGAAGMDSAEKMAKLFLAAPMMHEFFAGRPISVFDIKQHVLEALLECYRQFSGGKAGADPRIAIVDWKEVRTSAEFEAFREFCGERGYETVVADPRELDYDGHVLSYKGFRIDLIYRRVVSTEYIERLAEVKAMTQAFCDHNVCLVGSFRSDVAFSKKVFGLLHDPGFARFFTDEERQLVERHIPWTRPFEDGECEYRGKMVNMPDLARREKSRFVLKPSNLYEGRGVWLGGRKSQEEWDKLVDAALKSDYVLQELILIPSQQLGIGKEDIVLEPRFIHLGEYLFGGKFCGFYCRAAEGPLVDRTSREFLAPCFVLGE